MTIPDLSVVELVVLIGVACAIAGLFVGWLLRGEAQLAQRVGEVDLSAAAARGELQLDWKFPSPPPPPAQAGPVEPPRPPRHRPVEEPAVRAAVDGVCVAAAPMRVSPVGATPERAKLGLASNVVAIDTHRGSRRA